MHYVIVCKMKRTLKPDNESEMGSVLLLLCTLNPQTRHIEIFEKSQPVMNMRHFMNIGLPEIVNRHLIRVKCKHTTHQEM